jgi:hypothetical protein
MQRDDERAFKGLIEALCATFRVDPTVALIEGYRIALEDMPIRSIISGVRTALRDAQHMPRPAQIREMSGEIDDATKAALAWTTVVKSIRSVGSYRTPNFDQLTRRAVTACGGWKRLCSLGSDELHSWTRKRFEEMFCIYTESERREPPMIGDGADDGHAKAIVADLSRKLIMP